MKYFRSYRGGVVHYCEGKVKNQARIEFLCGAGMDRFLCDEVLWWLAWLYPKCKRCLESNEH